MFCILLVSLWIIFAGIGFGLATAAIKFLSYIFVGVFIVSLLSTAVRRV
jgi:hypothetical protein